jgi:hypothetical protein
MADHFHTTNFAWFLQDSSDEVLADAYAQYIDSPGSMYFSEIFWEANRRGLSLTDLEAILHNTND